MEKRPARLTEREQIQLLANFRSEIRRFLRFSEKAATAAGLEPQQHQLLLQIAGTPDGTLATLSHVAEAMCLEHHTAVELSKRCELAGLIRRTPDREDRRRVILELTAQGRTALRGLSKVHAQQLRDLAPTLIQALTRISNSNDLARSQSPGTTEQGDNS